MGIHRLRHVKPDPVEKYWPNCNYGHAKLLKEYSGYPMDRSVEAVIPHGVFYEDDYVYPGEAQAPVPCVLNWPQHRDAVWRIHKEVIPNAAPYLYALQMYPHAQERRGTLVMPQHATNLYDMDYDWSRFADTCRELPKPVTVVWYWNEIDVGDGPRYFHQVQKCFGHVNEPEFHVRQVLAMTGAKHVVSNEVGSYSYYAVASGCSFTLIDQPPMMRIGHPDFRSIFRDWDNKHPEEQRRMAEVTELFSEWRDEPSQEQKECADYYLRADALWSRQELHDALEYCQMRADEVRE